MLGALVVLSACGQRSESARVLGPSSSGNQAALTHTVAPGETIHHIAHVYGISSERLMAVNHLSDPRELRVGQVLLIPGAGRGAYTAAPIAEGWFAPKAARQFSWPVAAGQLSSPFGMRNGVMHDGIDIDAPEGTPIRAADAGTVIFAGRQRGYGNLVILEHRDGYVTVYGHNERNLVRQGETVARGETIAQMGATGRASGPNLHFEVRYNNRPQNPISYLPDPGISPGITFARNSAD